MVEHSIQPPLCHDSRSEVLTFPSKMRRDQETLTRDSGLANAPLHVLGPIVKPESLSHVRYSLVYGLYLGELDYSYV